MPKMTAHSQNLEPSFMSVYLTTTMETLPPCSFHLITKSKKCSITSLPSPQTHKISLSNNGCMRLQQSWPNGGQLSKMKCAKGGAVSELERKLEDEIILEEELMGMGKLKEKCKEMNGIAELLECLEREAIMGEDEGKEPTDYNRRAQIFDKSLRVFQALKERDDPKDS